MSESKPRPGSRKRLLAAGILTVLFLTVVWIYNFLAGLDLNDYRQRAEESLSDLLETTVRIESLDYHFHDTNLALHVTGLKIGGEDFPVRVEAPNILLDLQWRGLLVRNFTFAKINLIKPNIRLRSTIGQQAGVETPPSGPVPAEIDLTLLSKINVHALEIVDGVLQMEISPSAGKTHRIEVSEFDAVINGLGLDETTQFTLKGALTIDGQETNSPWRIDGRYVMALDDQVLSASRYDLQLQAKKLKLEAIGALLPQRFADITATGTGDLTLSLEGAEQGSVAFQTSLSSDGVALQLPITGYARPVSFRKMAVSGRLQARGDHPGIDDLALQLDESRLAGSVHWRPEDQPVSATVSLLNSSMTIQQIKQWLPETAGGASAFSSNLADRGSINIETAEFSWAKTAEAQHRWHIDRLNGELQQASWDNGSSPAAELISLPFKVTDNLWQINNALARWGSTRLAASGAGEFNDDGSMTVALDISGEAEPDRLLDEWRVSRDNFDPAGKIAFSGHLEGSEDKFDLTLQADLSDFSISGQAGLNFMPKADDHISLIGKLADGNIVIDHGNLNWAAFSGMVSGNYRIKAPQELVVDASLAVQDLAELAKAVPLLEKFKLSGEADLSIRMKGAPERVTPEMVLTLRNAGMRATRHIADLSQINGRILLTPTSLTANDLHLHLGQSPATVQAGITDFANPILLLDVKAPSLKADELVFHSASSMLRNVNGHLEIDRNGLSFAPVDVQLDGGTKASVRGTISFHPPHAVQLDISSEFARISEVIGLWTDRDAATRGATVRIEQARERKRPVPIRINARVKQGDLYGMSFQDATGVIVPTHGRLVIHPLDFSVGEGYCNAQVVTEFSPDSPALLQISGHAEDVDALEVYRELLNQQSIVRGKLRGDFYLVGQVGKNHLPSSYGNFSIQVHDGVLHKFHILSKVFSLLNISQIFALQLPDMDTKGLPFTSMTANFQLDKGILKSEDLKIRSEAMNQSYAGQFNLITKEVDLIMSVQPLGTVDKIVSRIPVAGWLLTGKDSALLAAYFSVKGKTDNVSVATLPLDSLSEPMFGFLKRTIGLPFKLAEDPQILWGGKGDKD